jgi:hypothetical protein
MEAYIRVWGLVNQHLRRHGSAQFGKTDLRFRVLKHGDLEGVDFPTCLEKR